jgi:hypothetical protein
MLLRIYVVTVAGWGRLGEGGIKFLRVCTPPPKFLSAIGQRLQRRIWEILAF